MTTKKKRKNTMDAIDKYLQQKRYSQGKKYERKEKPTKKTVQTDVSIPSNGLYSTAVQSNKGNRKSVRIPKIPEQKSVSDKLGKAKLTKNDTDAHRTNNVKSLQLNKTTVPKRVEQKTSRTKRKTAKIPPSTRASNTNRKNPQKSPKQLRSRKDKNNDVELSEESAPEGKVIRQNPKYSMKKARVVKGDLANKKSNRKNLLKSKPPEKSKKESIKRVKRTAKTLTNSKSKSEENFEDSPLVDSKATNDTYLVPKNSCDSQQENQVTDTICESSTVTVTNNVPDKRKETFTNADSCLPKKKRKIVIDDQPTKTNSSDEAHEPSCSSDDVAPSLQGENVGTEVTEEITPITKKYQPYMERLKQLSSDVIQKYIRDNQQYYVDYKKEVESKNPNVPLPGKKRKKYDDMRESFKCNPFNSDQQLAMYYTLREIFEVPKTHFVECRNLFTVLLPEISCQLFAETFHIKVSFAPRLIKKLYPNPVCPV